MTCLFVGNLIKTISEQKVIALFKSYGPCKVQLKVNKGPYAFVEYNTKEDAKASLKDLNQTNLQGLNGNVMARIEFAHIRKSEDKAEINFIEKEMDDYSWKARESSGGKKEYKNFSSNDASYDNHYDKAKKNVCFICKLPGHFAKDCILTREMCYECGEKGHIAKECKQNVREAVILTENRVKAIYSQQSSYKFITTGMKIRNMVNYLKNNNNN